MALSIRTNVSSLSAQRHLSDAKGALDGSLARLSSGFRISKASDDAAGLGISTKLESQIRSYTQATRNAHDGISVVQSAEAALNEQAGILGRLRELAMQAASDGIGGVERGYVDKEAKALISELDRINAVAEYNGTRLLGGTARTLDFHVGLASSADDVISVSLGGPPVGAWTTVASETYATGLASGGWLEPAAQAAAQAAAAGVTNATAAAYAGSAVHEIMLIGWRQAGGGNFPTPTATTPLPAGAARDAGMALVAATAGGGTGGNASLGAAYAAFASAVSGGSSLAAAFTAAQSASVVFTGDASLAIAAATAAQATFSAGYASVTGAAVPGTPPAGAARTAGLAALTGGGTGQGGVPPPAVSLGTKAGALLSLGNIDAALDQVSSSRATLGAAGNRFQSAVASIQAFSESLAAANGRIKDVDVAEETSRMSRSQILAQAAVSVLAQANQAPQLALKLLG